MFGPIKTVTVYVEDQQKAIEFYTQKLGFEIRRSLPIGLHANWVEISPPDAQTSLVLYPKAMMSNWAELKLSLVFYCPDVEATCRRLKSLGVRIGMQPKQMQWGIFATFLDFGRQRVRSYISAARLTRYCIWPRVRAAVESCH